MYLISIKEYHSYGIEEYTYTKETYEEALNWVKEYYDIEIDENEESEDFWHIEEADADVSIEYVEYDKEKVFSDLLDWAKNLQRDYEEKLDEKGSDVTYYSFADSAKDFIDAFIERIKNI